MLGLVCTLTLSGCATLFRWDIHAPAILSQRFYEHVEPAPQRLALYLDPSLLALISQNKGGRRQTGYGASLCGRYNGSSQVVDK